MTTKTEVNLGVFQFERETKTTKRFVHEDDDGKMLQQYVPKVVLRKLGDPDAIEVVIHVADGNEAEDE